MIDKVIACDNLSKNYDKMIHRKLPIEMGF